MADAKHVKADALARLFNLTTRRVQQLANEGIVVKVGRGVYDLLPSIHGYIRFLQDQIEGKPTTNVAREVNSERLRSLKIDNDLKAGTILSRDLVNEVTGICMASIARIADSLASRLPPLLSGDKTAAQRRLIIQNEIRAIRETGARELRSLAGADDASGHPETGSGENGGSVGKRKRNSTPRRRGTRPVSDRKNTVHGGASKGAN